MTIDFAPDPVEIFSWLNRFEPSSLTPSSRQLVAATQEPMQQVLYPDVDDLLEHLQEINKRSPEPYERAEVFFECGFAYSQMGYMNLAADCLKHAIRDFPSATGNNHKQAVTRCMLGVIEWLDPPTNNQAVIDWRRCIDEFEALRLRADRENQQARAEWYADHVVLLRAALTERVSQIPNRRGRPNNPVAGVSRRGSQPPDRYDILVRLVQGDREQAERWIDLERKNEPDCDRTEFIERAIAKLRRERR